MKPRYTLIWSTFYSEWICIDCKDKPINMTAIEYLYSDHCSGMALTLWKYLPNN